MNQYISSYYYRLALIIILVTILLGSASRAYAQTEVKILNSTIDGGGGTSVGGTFRLRGTIAQPDAGQMKGGAFTLTGGFWSAAITELTGETNKSSVFIPLVGR